MRVFNSRKGYARQLREAARAAEIGSGGRGAREMVDRRLNFFDERLVAAAISDVGGDSSHNSAIVGPEGRPPYQFVHICPVVPTGLAGSLLADRS
jgi:hypothetical protein